MATFDLQPRILMIDEEQATRSALAELLGGVGFCVEALATTADALARLPVFEPDVILADSQLSGLHERELVARIRAVERDLPIVLLTERASAPSTTSPDADHGRTLLVRKPVDVDVLAGVISAALAAPGVEAYPVPG